MVAATQVGLQTASKFYILLFKCIMVGLSTQNIFYGLRSISQAKSKAEFENRRIILNFYTPVHSPSLSLLEFSGLLSPAHPKPYLNISVPIMSPVF